MELQGWYSDFNFEDTDSVALEALADNVNTAQPKFESIRIRIESGVYYVTLYACGCATCPQDMMVFLVWLDSLKETDVVKLSVLSRLSDIPVLAFSSLLAGLRRTKATIEIQLDTIVFDTVSYFYLACPNIKIGSAGALFIPSYTDKNVTNESIRNRKNLEFIASLVDSAFDRGFLSAQDRDKLHAGIPVSLTFSQ